MIILQFSEIFPLPEELPHLVCWFRKNTLFIEIPVSLVQ